MDGSAPVVEQVKSSVMAAAKGLTVEFQSVKYPRGELEELANRLFSTKDQWAPGLSGASGGWDPEANRVLVSVRNNSAQLGAWADRVKALNDSRVVFRSHAPKPSSGLQGRMDDFRPWAVGNWLSWSGVGHPPTPDNNDCTGGWAWRKWTTNVYLGSTAYHCVWDGVSAHLTWYAGEWQLAGKLYGTAVRTHKGTDSALLGIEGCQCYAPLVWVGDSWTEDLRVVAGLKTSWYIGQPVALSAVNSGLHVAHVKSTNWDEDGYSSVAMYEEVSLGGDSGGPWLTTMPGSGDVVAHGQHLGVSDDPTTGSLFIRLNDISEKHQASVLLYP
ncbi:S1 family peptidase [Kribbella sp. NBC_00482]|uniref:hypothetical protein n=1 Tax=Kribbella sp. NBC_00482 TaxID=2975968 RepID=UPI002E18FEBA